MRRFVLSLIAAALAGCAHRAAAIAPNPPERDETFLELKAGYRLRVITPLTRSGAYRVATETLSPARQGEPITLRTNGDFLGYETAYYAVDPAPEGVRVRLLVAEQNIAGNTSAVPDPKLRLSPLSHRIRHIRLVYLIRQSTADHDMAIVGADTAERLAPFTSQVRANAAACKSSRNLHCSWVPAGIAVRAEMPTADGGWVPVR
jgi:hypothetical protein